VLNIISRECSMLASFYIYTTKTIHFYIPCLLQPHFTNLQTIKWFYLFSKIFEIWYFQSGGEEYSSLLGYKVISMKKTEHV
jgi:hypothetical protein